jgi:hypothetical protein
MATTADKDFAEATGRYSWIRWAAAVAVACLLGGAAYLVAMRGDALLVDLSALTRSVFCF